MDIAKVEDGTVTEQDILDHLKFNNEMGSIAQKVVNRKIVVQGAKKLGLAVSDKELQGAADAFRKLTRMFKAKDVMEWLDTMKTDMDRWEKFLEEQLLTKKIINKIATDDNVEAYFKTNVSQFETVEISQIILRSMDAGNEAVAMLEDGYDFGELATEQSIDDATKNAAGFIGRANRSQLPDLVAAKVFNATNGDILGPFQIGENRIAVIKIIKAKSCKFTSNIKKDIAKILFEQWRDAQANILKVEWV